MILLCCVLHVQHQQGLPLAPHARTVSQYVKQVRRDHKGMRVSLAIEGMDTFFRYFDSIIIMHCIEVSVLSYTC